MTICSFKCKQTRNLFEGKRSRKFQLIERSAITKLFMLNRAMSLEELKIPLSNHLEALKHDRIGQYSIRINAQFRLCFRWYQNEAYDVEIVDYH